MTIRFPGKNSFSRMLNDSAEQLTQEEQTRQRILDGVMDSAGIEDRPSYREAAAELEELNRQNQNSRKTTGSVFIGSGILAVAAALIITMYPSQTPAWTLETIEDADVPLGNFPSPVIVDSQSGYWAEVFLPDEDEVPPLLDRIEETDGRLALYLTRDALDADWISIYGEDLNGIRIEPQSVDFEEGQIVFDIPQDEFWVLMVDANGRSYRARVVSPE